MTRRPPWTWELEGRLALALILLTMTAFALPRPLYPAAQSGPRAPTDRERLEALVAEGERLVGVGDLDGAIAAYRKAATFNDADRIAGQLEGTRTVLDLMYGQMLTAAATGEWDRAIDLSAQLLRQMPAYRDVSARRAGYLEQLYTSASASLSEGDIPQAVKLFTALVAAEPGYRDAADKLRQARLASTKPLAGGYAVGEILRRGEWDVTLASVIVESDGRLTVAVKWSNASGSDRTATCSGDVGRGLRPLLTLADGVGIAPTETACSLRSGEVIPAGKAFTESATFPPLADATRPFRVSWYGVGISREIVLRP